MTKETRDESEQADRAAADGGDAPAEQQAASVLDVPEVCWCVTLHHIG